VKQFSLPIPQFFFGMSQVAPASPSRSYSSFHPRRERSSRSCGGPSNIWHCPHRVKVNTPAQCESTASPDLSTKSSRRRQH
jgi:hypothetical protein